MSYDRMDNQEDGDLDPYLHICAWNGTQNGAPNRITQTGGAGSSTDNMNTAQLWLNNSNEHPAQGFRRRGLPNETYNYFSFAIQYDFAAATYPLTANSGNPDQVATTVSTVYVREAPWFYVTPYTAQLSAGRMRKGQPRWIHMIQGGTVNATLDSLQWFVGSSTAVMLVVGPWDGATTPSF
jgi:hypothetical protein